MIGDWGRSFGEELHYFYCLQDIRLITSRTTRYAKREIHTGVWRKCIQSFGEETEMKENTWKAWT